MRRFRYLVVTLLVLSVPLVLMVRTYDDAVLEAGGRPMDPLWKVLAIEGTGWYVWAVVIPLIDRLVRTTGTAARDRVLAVVRHVGLAVSFSVARSLLLFVVSDSVASVEHVPGTQAVARQLVPTFLTYTVAVIGFTIAERRRRDAQTAQALRAQLAEARLDALRQQLNPHFLFNTLNHIVMQLRQGATGPAELMLLSLSDLLREVLRDRGQVIPLSEELRIVEQYLAIERARFGDRLRAALTYEPKALELTVPCFLLQPLVENALRHGTSQGDGQCDVSVIARVHGARLVLEVRDAGPGADPDRLADARGIGLRNTRERLQYLYPGDHTLTIDSGGGRGLAVTIDLPASRGRA